MQTVISDWYTDNRLTINVKKTKFMLAGSKRMLSLFEDFELQPNGTQIDRVQSFKYLRVTTDAKWSWKPHISNLLKKLGHRLSLFNRIFHMLDNRTRIAFYNGLVLPPSIFKKVLELSCKALSSLPLDEGKLLKDLNDNFMVKRELEMITGGLSLRYGKYMIIASTVLLTAKDVDFVKESASEDSSLVKRLIKFLS